MATTDATIQVEAHVITANFGQIARFYTQHQDMLNVLAKHGIYLTPNEVGITYLRVIGVNDKNKGMSIHAQEYDTFYEAFECALEYLDWGTE